MKLSLLNTSTFNIKLSVLTAFILASVSAKAQQPSANFSANKLSGCVPLAVNFTDLSSGNPKTWQWNLGNGTTSSQKNPTTTYFVPGIYTVTLKASNAFGSNTITKTQYIRVYDKPTVDFGVVNFAGCFPLRSNFLDASKDSLTPITSWAWDFGDGNLSSLQNPIHNYNVAGNYSVTLKVTNAGGCATVLSKPNLIQVSAGVTSKFTNSSPVLCRPPETINFTALSTGPGVLTYQWLFGDGGTSNIQNPSHTYLTGGNFNDTLITQSSLGCIDTLIRPAGITIKNVVSKITAPDSVCKGATYTFNNASIPASGGSAWNFGDATTSALTNPTKAYAALGTYTIQLVNNYGTCTDTTTKPIKVIALPVPNFTSANPYNCSVPYTVNFKDSSNTAVGWKWSFGDGGTSNLQNPSHTYTAMGNYTVTLIITGPNGCSDSISKPQFVKLQKPITAINGLPVSGCVPFTITPTPNVTSVEGVASYLWDFGDGTTSTLQNPTHTYPLQGTYTVKLFITTNGGCKDSSIFIKAVKVGTYSQADFSANLLAQCVGQPVQFTNLTNPSDTWNWSFGDGGTSSAQNPSYIYQDTGKFTVTLTALNNGCPSTITKINFITALPPVARFNSVFNCNNKLSVQFIDQSILPQSWTWDFGDGSPITPINFVQYPTHVYAVYGNYTVKLTVTNNACTNPITHTISLFNELADFTITKDTICTSQNAVFQAIGMNAANVATYTWDFGDGSPIVTTPSSSVAHNYTLSNFYTVTLTITDTRGCVSLPKTKINIVRVYGPISNFSFTPLAGCRPLTVNFTDLSTTDGVHAITKWAWDFGDGKTQTYTQPPFKHIYDTIGNFYARLTVTDSYGCPNSFLTTTPVFVTKPKAGFTSNDILTCIGKNVNFTNTSVGIGLSYLWVFGDGTTSTQQNPVKIYTADSDYTIKLFVTDINGCVDSSVQTKYIKIHTVKASFSVNDSISSCTPFQVIFTNTSLYSTSALWFFGDGTSTTLAQPTHYYSAIGSYTSKIIVSGPGGCTDSATKNIILYPSTASLTYSPFNGCSPLAVNFHASTPGPVTYLWDFNDGTTLTTTDSNIVYNYLLPGEFLPKVILKDQTGCQIPVNGLDTIFVTKSYVKFLASDSLFCDKATVQFTDSTKTNGKIVQYNWIFGDGGTSTLQNPSHIYPTTGLYTVRLIVTTANGCNDTLTKTNYIRIVATPVVAIGGNIPVCMKSPLTLTGIVVQPDTSQLRWHWDFGNKKTSLFQNPLPVVYDTSGNFQLVLIATNSSGCADTVKDVVLVYPLPVINAGGPTKTILVGSSFAINPTGSPVVDYLWSPPTALSCTNCYNTVASPKNTITYTIKVTDANGCVNSDNITLIVVCNDKNVFMPNTFSPNNDGVNDIFYPRGTGLFTIQSMKIFNRWGQMVFQRANLVPNDPSAGWDGKYNGKVLNIDVYTYIIEIVCENSQTISIKGNVSLIQ